MTNPGFRGIWLFTITLLLTYAVYGQEKLPPKLKFHSLKVEDGLPNNIINAIVQDSLGFIWIGTNDGLCRYDGKNFKNYRETFPEMNTISNNYIQSLFLDSKGYLWIMTDQGLNRYDQDKEQFKIFSRENEGGLSHNSVTDMVELSDGTYCIGSYGGGVDVFNGDRVTESYGTFMENPISSDLISTMEKQSGDALWVGTFDGGLSWLDIKAGSVRNYGFGQEKLTTSARINSLYQDRQGFLWIGTDYGITVFNPGTEQFFKVSSINCRTFPDDDVLSLFEDSEGTIWIGTRNAGMVNASRLEILNMREGAKFAHYEPSDGDESVNYRSVSSFFQDTEQNIWIATHQGGVNIVNPNGEAIRYYSSFSDGFTGENQSVWGICEDAGSGIWLGTDGEGLVRFDPVSMTGRRYRHDPEDPMSLSDDAILAACMDSQQAIWLGTYAGGINKLSPGSSKFKQYRRSLDPSSINSDDVRVIFEDSKKRIWIGSNGGGLQKYREDYDDFEFIQDIGWLDIRAISEDEWGRLWVGTFGNGLYSYNPDTGEMKQYPEIEKFGAHIIFDLHYTPGGNLWVGTRYKGLLHFNLATNEVRQFTEKDGLTNNTVQAIVGSSGGRLWISTNDGLNQMDTSKGTFTTYKSASGVQSGQFNNGSGFLSRNGYLVFGGIGGLNIFYPEDVQRLSGPKKVHFTDFKLFNESVSVNNDSLASPLQVSISRTSDLELQYDQNDITIEYIALEYPSTKDVNYAYILENYDDGWNYVGNSTRATYRNLGPDSYMFRVKVVDESGSLSEESSVLHLRIVPPIWETTPALILYVLFALLLVYTIVKYYIDQVKLKNSLFFEKKLRQKEADLNQERFRFFTSFSHELRTPLTLIMGPINDLIREESRKKERNRLELVQRNARVLLELINKMLEFRKTETEHNHLELGCYAFDEFVQEIFANFRFYSEQKEINFNFTAHGEYFLWFDYKKIQLVINNVLSNAFKYTPKGGTISIEIGEEDEMVLLHITDTGAGIKKEAQASIFDLYFHSDLEDVIEGTGIGLALCKKLMELHRGDISVQSEPGNGSRFTISLHKQKRHYEDLENVEFVSGGKYLVQKPFIKASVEKLILPANDSIGKDDKVILIVDDNEDVVNYVSDIMSPHFKVITAYNGQEGIDKAVAYIPDLIISDIMMPEKSGTDLCSVLKSQSPTSHIPIILLTAKMEGTEQLRSMYIGADSYITKPFDSEYLMARVSNLFSNREKLILHYQKNSSNPSASASGHSETESKFLKKLEEKIMEQLDSGELSAPDLAQELGFSRSSLYRKVRAVTGLSINQFSRQVRLNKAALLMKSESMSVSQVAYEVGFSDLKYFRSAFKEQFGVLPSTYRNRSGQGNIVVTSKED